VPVKIVLDPNPALGTLVRPGMSVEATIDTRAAGPETPAAISTEKASIGPAVPAPASGR